MIESPLDPVALYDKLEKERAENDRLKEEIVYLKLEYDKLTDWVAEYKAENAKWKNAYEEEAQDHAKTAINLQRLISELKAENAKLNQEIEKFKGYLEAWGSNE